ncbi:hypothetical protein KY284_008540 [Solanum tuberosum]|nr:hypothetical protein KY284_008540 [Solanum tuberosum]
MDVPKVILKETIFKLLDNFVDLTFEFVDQPLSPSQSNFAPVEEIGEAVRVTIIQGKIPDDFPEGVYIRNGSNPLFGGLKSTKSIFGKSSHLWVEGEGMLHALYFTKEKEKGNKWNILYKNKYVETDTFNMEKNLKKPGFIPNIEGDSLAVLVASLLNVMRFGVLHKYISNTNVFEHSKKYYSIAENHMPQEINIQTLETLGNWTVNGSWSQSFTSHPKKIPDTSELVTMGINPLKPYLELGVISADGKQMVHKVDVKLNRCIICHEIGVTKRYNVILDFPLTIDLNRLIIGEQLIKYDKDGYARIGIMPHYGDANSIKWFEIEPCCVFHIINCFEDNDEVVVRACRARRSIIPRPDIIVDEFELSLDELDEMNFSKNNVQMLKEIFSFFRVCEWRLNMKTGEVKLKDTTTTDHQYIMEFPMINEHFIGGFAKFGGLAKLHFEERQVENSKDNKEEEDLIKVDYHIFPKNTFCSGATFVPKLDGVDEDDGWIVAFTHNENTNQSQSNFAPVEEIGEAVRVTTIQGEIPNDFPEGVYIRNGANPLFGGLKSTKSIFGKSSHIWIEGEGMLHALYFTKEKEKGNKWNILYKNKYVETDTFNMEKDRKKPSIIPNMEGDALAVFMAFLLNVLRFGVFHKYLSNTSVFEHSKKYYSIAENHMPQEINIQTLETLGNWTVNGAWNRSFTAHPKKVPGTGELVIMGTYPLKPYFELGVISADGKQMIHKVDLKLNRCILCHEIGVTKRYNVILDFPLTMDLTRLIIGEELIKYNEDGYARIGIMPRYGDANSIKWFEVEPCYVVVRACRARRWIIPRPNESELSLDTLNETSFNKDNIESSKDLFSFFNVCEWRLNMKTAKNLSGGFAKFGGLAKLHFEEISKDIKEEEDLIKVEYHIFPKNTFCSGATFVPKLDGVDEDDGWILTFTHNENTNQSQVYIVDAENFESEPIAIILLPNRVPYGFHGAFMPFNL